MDTPRKTLFGGDFHCLLKAADCSKGAKADSSSIELRKLLRDFDLQDVTELTTVPTPRNTPTSRAASTERPDRVYVSSGLAAAGIMYKAVLIAFSDHACVIISIGMVAHRTVASSWRSGWEMSESFGRRKALRDNEANLTRAQGKAPDQDNPLGRAEVR